LVANTTIRLDDDDYLFLLNGPPGNPRAVTTLLTTLWAAWVVACRVERTKETEVSKIVNLIVAKASERTLTRPASRFGSAGSRTKEQKDNAWKYFYAVQERIPTNAITVYTDGSSLGNPGPAGAGAWARFLDQDYFLWAPMGTGSNNEGEVWAIGMALAFLRRFPDLTEAHFLSDSEYALKGVKGFRSRGSLPIHLWLRLIKSHLRRRPGKVFFHWVPGHLGIDGNEKADVLAKKGAKASLEGRPRPEPLFGFFEAT
jgi:ribonuclease HI